MRLSISPRAARLGRMFTHWAEWAIVFAAIIQLCIYANDVHTRRTQVPSCKWNQLMNPYSAPYAGRFCHFSNDMVLLQLYDASSQDLLAERMYPYPDSARFFWRLDSQRRPYALGYDTYTGDAISLPPTLLDRLRAKLP